MAKKKSEVNIFAELANETGGKILKGSGDSKYFIDTGNLAVNYINSGKFITGGVPTGIIECFGPPSSSKSLLAYTLLGRVQKMNGWAILLDCERAVSETFAEKAAHVDPNKLLVYHPFFIEEVESKVINIIKKIRERDKESPILFVFDSIGVTPCKREWAEVDLPENYTAAEFKKIVGRNESPGERAKAAGKFLRKINPILDENGASLFIINQIRAAIGQYGMDETTAGGGKALPFYANCRIRTATRKTIEDKKRKIPIGINLKFTNKKSRSFTPFLSTEGVQLYFEKGINPISGLLTVLIGAGRVTGSGGNYTVAEPWAKGEKVTFKSSLERNDVPIEALLKCPAIIDAETPDQIKEYLGSFVEAIEVSGSPDTVEIEGPPDVEQEPDSINLEELEKELDADA